MRTNADYSSIDEIPGNMPFGTFWGIGIDRNCSNLFFVREAMARSGAGGDYLQLVGPKAILIDFQ
jgi:hypothetical protein